LGNHLHAMLLCELNFVYLRKKPLAQKNIEEKKRRGKNVLSLVLATLDLQLGLTNFDCAMKNVS
jgi:hypothetical protein